MAKRVKERVDGEEVPFTHRAQWRAVGAAGESAHKAREWRGCGCCRRVVLRRGPRPRVTGGWPGTGVGLWCGPGAGIGLRSGPRANALRKGATGRPLGAGAHLARLLPGAAAGGACHLSLSLFAVCRLFVCVCSCCAPQACRLEIGRVSGDWQGKDTVKMPASAFDVLMGRRRVAPSRFARAARLFIERDFRDCKRQNLKGWRIRLVRERTEARYTGLLALRRLGLPTDVAKDVLDDAIPPCQALLLCCHEVRRTCRHCSVRSRCLCTDCQRVRRQMPRLNALARLGRICGADAVAMTARFADRYGGVDEMRERVIRGLKASIQEARDI